MQSNTKEMVLSPAVEQFMQDVDKGLSAKAKQLSSKYFYDKIGDALFVKIMNLPEYYLTRSELEIFTNKTERIIKALQISPDNYFELVELGAGDGLKTKQLLAKLCDINCQFDYLPIDISGNALDLLEANLNRELPKVNVKKQQGDYFGILESLKVRKNPKIVLFLGSNIGNMTDDMAADFVQQLDENLAVGDNLFLGVDRIKSASIVLPAYSDSQGVTAAFNFNLLDRINRELGGNFDTTQFSHKATYDETEGIVRSYLVSRTEQSVWIECLNKAYAFEAGERIHTEVSRKYNDEIINQLIAKTDFSIVAQISDSKNYFTNYILEKR